MPTVPTAENPKRSQSVAVFPSIVRMAALTLLFSASAVYEAIHRTALSNGDVWWHLRTGLWLLQNHAVPRTGIFSQYSNLPWMASSWGYDLLLASVYSLVGLRAIPIVLMAFKVALAVVTFLLGRAGRVGFWRAVLLSAIAQYVISNLQPLPSVLSMVFLGIELWLLVRSRESGSARGLYWLPVLFIAWANLDLQFASGLVLLGLFVAAVCVEGALRSADVRWLDERIAQLPLRQVGALAGCSLLATCLTPYTYHLLPSVIRALYSDALFQYSAEMHAMNFRRPQEYALMLLVMAAFLALGRRRALRIFELSALIAGTAIAFRIQRDSWMAVLPAVAVLAEGFHFRKREVEETDDSTIRWLKPVAAAVAITFVVAAARLPDRTALMSKVSQTLPVKACDFIRENHLPPPLFNPYSWGGFLTWYLSDYPVAIDGRFDLYGDEILTGYFNVTAGSERLETYPAVASARTLLLERQSGMTKALTDLPALRSKYRLVYSDDLAAVFVPQ